MSDIDALYNLCLRARGSKGSEKSIVAIRQWLNRNEANGEFLRNAVLFKGKNNWTPLHVLVRVHPPPNVVELLLEVLEQLMQLVPDAVQERDQFGKLPLQLACRYGVTSEVWKIVMREYLNRKPDPNIEFYCTLQSLPVDARKEAVTNYYYVQSELNRVLVCQRFPTFVLFLDFYVILVVLICNGIAVSRYNGYLYTTPASGPLSSSSCENPNHLNLNCKYPHFYLFPSILLGAAGYFVLRQSQQILSLAHLGFVSTWYSNSSNYVQVICNIFLISSSIAMLTGAVHTESSSDAKQAFRSLSVIFSGVFFYLLFPFGRRISKDFAVFDRGMTAVIRRLFGFGVYVVIILTAFALMFFTAFQGSEDCSTFCDFYSSWFQVYNMMLGNYGPEDIFFASSGSSDNSISQSLVIYFLYFSFGVIVVIMILNVLIPIVWDAYSSVKNAESANTLFWEIRLEFVTEVMVISSLTNNFICNCGMTNGSLETYLEAAWSKIEKVYEDPSTAHWYIEINFFIIRVELFLFVILEWFLLGLATAGLLWPPQIRKWVWHASFPEASQDSVATDTASESNLEEMRTTLAMVCRLVDKISKGNISDCCEVELDLVRVRDLLEGEVEFEESIDELRSLLPKLSCFLSKLEERNVSKRLKTIHQISSLLETEVDALLSELRKSRFQIILRPKEEHK